MSRNEKWMTLGCMAFGAIFAFGGLALYGVGWPNAPKGGFLPFWTGLILMGLSGIHLFLEWKSTQGEEKPLLRRGHIKGLLLTSLSLLGYSFLMRRLGFLLTTFLFLVFLLRFVTPQKWKVAVGFSVLIVLFVYALFILWLETPLPEGALGNYLPF